MSVMYSCTNQSQSQMGRTAAGPVTLGNAGNTSVASDLRGVCLQPEGWVAMVGMKRREGEVIPPGSPFIFVFEQREVPYR